MPAGELQNEADVDGDRRERVRAAINALPTDEARVVRLQHVGGMTHVEIAETLGITLATVRARSHRAHRRLAEGLGHLRGERAADALRMTSTGSRLATPR